MYDTAGPGMQKANQIHVLSRDKTKWVDSCQKAKKFHFGVKPLGHSWIFSEKCPLWTRAVKEGDEDRYDNEEN